MSFYFIVWLLEFYFYLHTTKKAKQNMPNTDKTFANLLGLRSVKVLFTNPSARAGYDTRSIFKRSLTGLNSEFSFS